MDISDRIKYSRLESTKLNIVDSLNAFQAKNIQLKKLEMHVVGLLPWYCNRDGRNSSDNVEVFKSSSLMGAITFEPPLLGEEGEALQTPEEGACNVMHAYIMLITSAVPYIHTAYIIFMYSSYQVFAACSIPYTYGHHRYTYICNTVY